MTQVGGIQGILKEGWGEERPLSYKTKSRMCDEGNSGKVGYSRTLKKENKTPVKHIPTQTNAGRKKSNQVTRSSREAIENKIIKIKTHNTASCSHFGLVVPNFLAPPLCNSDRLVLELCLLFIGIAIPAFSGGSVVLGSSFFGPFEMNSLLSNVHTTYGSLLSLRPLASRIRTTIFPFGGPTVGLVVCVASRVIVVKVVVVVPDPDLDTGVMFPGTGRGDGAALLVGAVATTPFNALPADVVPRGVAGGVSFPSRKAAAVSLNAPSFSVAGARNKQEGET